MAYLEKLSIQGMRSFGGRDEDKQVMNFYSAHPTSKRDANGRVIKEIQPWPLTLILGQNGCGKTTIIECLRYVTTGETPPGSKSGKSFVHDPKMAGEVTVLGNVKLGFSATNRKKYVINRSIEATQKAKNITIKSIDGTVNTTNAQGERTMLSMKCADMNNAVLDYLGVSKPILNYVIFCHQEDSNWPLDEGGKVKAKFDEIFASDKYQNCLKNIKDTAKKQRDELRVEKKTLEYLMGDKKMAADKKRELEDKKTKANVLMDQVMDAEEQIKPIEEELKTIHQIEHNYAGAIQAQAEAKTRREEKRKQIQEIVKHLSSTIDETMTDDQVANHSNRLEMESRQAEKNVEMIKSEIADLQMKVKLGEQERARKFAEVGEYQGLQKLHRQNKKDLDEKVMIFGKQLGWPQEEAGVSGDDDAMERMLKKLKANISDVEKEMKRLSQEMDVKLEEKSTIINDLEKNKALGEDAKKRMQSEVIESKKEIAIITRDLRDTQERLEKLRDIEQQHKSREAELQKVQSSNNVEELRAIVQAKTKELKELEARESSLREEKAMFDANQKVVADIELKVTDCQERRKKLEAQQRKAGPKLLEIFGTGNIPSLELMKDRFNRISEQISSKKKGLESEMQTMRHDTKTKKEKRSELQAEVKVREEKIRKFDEEVSDVNLSDDNIETALETLKREIDVARENVSKGEAKRHTFLEFIATMNETAAVDKACPTCYRKFHKLSEAEDLKAELQEEIDKIPAKVKVIKESLNKSLIKQEKLQMLLPEKKQIDECRKEVEDKKRSIKSLETELKKLEGDHTHMETDLSAVTSQHLACEDLRDTVFEMDNLHRHIKDLEAKLNELRSQNSDVDTGRSLEEFQNEETLVSGKISSVRQTITKKQAQELEVGRTINKLQMELNSLQQEKLSISKKQQDATTLDKRRTELRGKVDALTAEMKKIEDKLNATVDDLEMHIREKNRLGTEKDKKLDAAQKQCNDVRRMEGELQNLVNKIQSYETTGNEKKLEERISIINDIVSKITSSEALLKKSEESRSQQEMVIKEKNEQSRQIQEHLRLRRLKREEKELAEEVIKFDGHLKALNFDSEKERKAKIIERYHEINRQKSERRGRLDEMKSTIRSLEKELNMDKFREAERKFREQTISHRCRQHAIQDLEKYHKALSYAITRFHQERMKVINQIVRELWRATYKGNDIDYIEIKTDDVDPDASMEKRKLCNYQVVMTKNNTEMEMRGRCSAGQKVLASLIIRLALAETFSANCGIIALDEPTTNLDRDNIDSLAEALANIVEKRRNEARRNFQLIVITHDEELISALGRGVPEQNYYYKISRNEMGLSQIRRFNIEGIGTE